MRDPRMDRSAIDAACVEEHTDEKRLILISV